MSGELRAESKELPRHRGSLALREIANEAWQIVKKIAGREKGSARVVVYQKAAARPLVLTRGGRVHAIWLANAILARNRAVYFLSTIWCAVKLATGQLPSWDCRSGESRALL